MSNSRANGSAQAMGDDFLDETAPDSPNGITNAAILRGVRDLTGTVRDLSDAVGELRDTTKATSKEQAKGLRRLFWGVLGWAVCYGLCFVLLGLLIWWTRGGK